MVKTDSCHFFKSTLLRYDFHTMKHAPFKCMVQWILRNIYNHVTTTAIKIQKNSIDPQSSVQPSILIFIECLLRHLAYCLPEMVQLSQPRRHRGSFKIEHRCECDTMDLGSYFKWLNHCIKYYILPPAVVLIWGMPSHTHTSNSVMLYLKEEEMPSHILLTMSFCPKAKELVHITSY